jgi:hypothetical protein
MCSQVPVEQNYSLLPSFSRVRPIFERFFLPFEAHLASKRTLIPFEHMEWERARPPFGRPLYDRLRTAYVEGDMKTFRDWSKDIFKVWPTVRSLILYHTNHPTTHSDGNDHGQSEIDNDVNAGDQLIKELHAFEVREQYRQACGFEAIYF